MTKAELLDAVAKRSGVTKADAERVVDALFSTVTTHALTGDKVTWPGFGHFTVAKTPARESRNPTTGQKVMVAPKTKMKFTSAAALKTALNAE